MNTFSNETCLNVKHQRFISLTYCLNLFNNLLTHAG